MILLAATLVLTAACVSRADQDSRTAAVAPASADGRAQAFQGRVPVREHCPASVKAITYYRKAYTASRTAMNLAGAVPRVWYQRCPVIKRRAVEWRNRSSAARRALATWTTHHYAWWEWMPRGSKWYRVASCETGYGRDPNFAHDSGTYVSAFGIYRSGYADDAHRVGNLGWDETIQRLGRIPSPLEQWQAMQSHRAAHGGWDGWGCRAA